MNHYDISKLKRNPDAIKKLFKRVGDSVIVLDDISIIFPDRYINRELVVIGSSVKLISIYAIIDQHNNYGVVNKPIFQDLTPYDINDISINDKAYKELSFSKNDVFIANVFMVRSDTFIYNIFDEFFVKGNIPWYLNYEDTANMLTESQKYANIGVGNQPLTFEILTSMIARLNSDKKVFFRQTDHDTKKLSYIGLNNKYYSFDNTGSKLVGGYFGDGVTNAIIDKESNTSEVTKILRA